MGNELTDLQLLGIECIDDASFVELSFDHARLVQSNLGGQGGRCVDKSYCNLDKNTVRDTYGGVCPADQITYVSWQDQCQFQQPSLPGVPPVFDAVKDEYTSRGNQHVMFRTLGFNYNNDETSFNGGWEEVWMSINNVSEYRAWKTGHNGVKRQSFGDVEGFFGAVNLLGPRATTQQPADKYWNSYLTVVQLRYDFLTPEVLLATSILRYCVAQP